jgi:hypothetical protein
MDKQALIEMILGVLTPVLRNAGFVKKGLIWRRKRGDFTDVLSVQRSQWGPVCYINLGLSINALSETPLPLPHRCHVEGRLSEHNIQTALDGDSGMSEDERLDRIDRGLREEALPWFDAASSIDALRTIAASGQFRALLTGEAQKFLDPSV